MAEGALDDATFAAYSRRPGQARARRRLQLARVGQLDAARARVPRRAPGPQPRDVLRRRAHPRVAGARARGRSRPAAARRAHQPPRHRVARVAGDASADARRRDRPRRARPLVPRGGRHVRARARGRQDQVLQGHLAPVARREGAARARARPHDREAADRDRQARALRRPLQRRHPLAPGVLAREEARQDGPALDRGQGRQGPRLRLQAARALRPRGLRARGRAAEDRRPHAAAGRRDVARARRARLARRRQRHRQDDADHGADRRARVRRRQGAPRAQRQARAARPARRGAAGHRHGGRGLPARDRPDAQQRAVAAGEVPVQRRGRREAARRPLRRRAPAPLAGDPRAAPAPTS